MPLNRGKPMLAPQTCKLGKSCGPRLWARLCGVAGSNSQEIRRLALIPLSYAYILNCLVFGKNAVSSFKDAVFARVIAERFSILFVVFFFCNS